MRKLRCGKLRGRLKEEVTERFLIVLGSTFD